MVAEGLSGLMKEAKRCNLFSGYKVDDNGCEVGLKYFLQFEPAPRRGEPDVTRRTPDYFL